MRIAYASDLHLEFDDSLTLTGLSGVDVLVLAGDVDTMPEYYTEFLRKLRLAYAGSVIFVLGNHEYYHGVFPDDRQQYRNAIAHGHQDSIAWLDDQFTSHPHDGPTVVITHHAPSYKSQHPRFAGSPISGGFCSNQEHRIQRWKPEGTLDSWTCA